ncbi:MAG: hypothetical protein M3Y70_06780 [Pseudomonadota bacterium]|nr:hypothetical protein [Pseudomonadota bacterium]
MSKATLVSIAATALVLLCSQTSAANSHRVDPAHDEAALRSLVAYATAEIRSREDLIDHLQRLGNRSPIAALRPAARERFMDSLAFNENGLTQYRYDVLRENLTASQSYRILKLFGAEGSGSFLRTSRVETDLDAAIASLRMMDDHQKAKCVSPHNCQRGWVDFICMSGC